MLILGGTVISSTRKADVTTENGMFFVSKMIQTVGGQKRKKEVLQGGKRGGGI